MKPLSFFIKLFLLFFYCVFVFVSFSGCREKKQPAASESKKPVLALSILPQKYFASRIGGDLIETIVLAGAGQNPHNYDVTLRQMQELAGADAWILCGVEFEIMVKPKIENLFSNLKIIDGVEGLNFRFWEASDPEDMPITEHLYLEIDPHTWLGLEGAKLISARIADCLCNLDEINASFYRTNHESLIQEMEEVFDGLRHDLAPLKGEAVFVYHPSFGYFLDEFGIIQEAVETEGKEPTLRQLGNLIEKAQLENVKAIFVQAQFPVAAAVTVANAIGAEVIILDPLAEDWLGNIQLMGEALKRAAMQKTATGELP